MTTEQKRLFWQQHIDSWQQSSLPQSEYCKQHDLKLANFGYWRTRLKKPTSNNKLIPVILPSTAQVKISLPNGICLALPAHMLAEVLSVLHQFMESP